MKDICRGCGKDKFIVNKTHMLCLDCNHFRLHKKTRFETAKEKFDSSLPKLKIKPLKQRKWVVKSTTKTKEKRQETLCKDRETYFKVFKNKPHNCEECDMPLPEVFEDENGDIVMIAQYSHILGKQAWPEFRHNPENFNRLCMGCHDKWDHGDKRSMKIYEKNGIIIEKLKNNKI
jgi:hypothetical protein